MTPHLPQHLQQQLSQHVPHYFAYMLRRAALVLLGWGAAYWILTAASTHLPPAVVYFAGVSWVLAGVVGFGYLYRLRCEAVVAQNRSVGAEHTPT